MSVKADHEVIEANRGGRRLVRPRVLPYGTLTLSAIISGDRSMIEGRHVSPVAEKDHQPTLAETGADDEDAGRLAKSPNVILAGRATFTRQA